jgi:hypothetical protein
MTIADLVFFMLLGFVVLMALLIEAVVGLVGLLCSLLAAVLRRAEREVRP